MKPLQTFEVPSSRLAWGTWNHSKNREEGKGDIRKAYCCQSIAEASRIKEPFRFNGALWVSDGGSERESLAYRIVNLEDFDGRAQSYSERVKEWQSDDLSDEQYELGFYHSMRAKWNKQTIVCVGPPVRFVGIAVEAAPKANLLGESKAEQLSLF